MLNSNDMEKAKKVQLGLMQFEGSHLPVRETPGDEDSLLICASCEVDFPCDRMLSFMLLQAISSLSAMIPSGNMAGLMARFAGGGKG